MKYALHILSLLFLFGCQDQTPMIKGIPVSDAEAEKIRILFPNQKFSSGYRNYAKAVLKAENYSDQNIPLDSGIDSVDNIVEISAWDNSDTTTTEITISGQRIGMLDDICVELTDSLFIIAWISRPFYKSKGAPHSKSTYSLQLKCIERLTGTVLINQEIYSTKFGIDRLSMIYNSFTKSIVFSYNDFSKSNSDYLMYGFIELKETSNPILKPKQVILHDKSEKRYPKFLKGHESLYLYHTSGDNWGLLSGHTGKKALGISIIDDKNEIINYRIILDELPINEHILLMDGNIYYRVENSRKYSEMKIMKVKLVDLFE